MSREKETLNFCLDKIRISEPAAVVTVNGNGKDIIYESLVTRCSSLDSVPLLFAHVVSEDELRGFIEKVSLQVTPVLVILNMTLGKDVSWVLDTLDNFRRTKGVKFNYILFSYFKEVSDAANTKHQALSRSLKVLKIISFTDCTKLITDFVRRYSYKPTNRDLKTIYRLSGGHVGLIKAIYMLIRSDKKFRLDVGSLLKEPSITSRIGAIKEDLASVKTNMFSIKSPLFNNISNTNLAFSKNELATFEFLKENLESIISRDDIAKNIWKEAWEEKYSDWAIDQLVHRLKSKIIKNKIPYKILSKKGRGFILTSKKLS